MAKINKLLCSTCGAENPIYFGVCSECRGYLRDRVVNIDLWAVISLLIYSPVNAFKNIICSEHKNFVIFINVFTSLKILLAAFFIVMLFGQEPALKFSLGISLILIAAAFFLMVLLFSFIRKLTAGFFSVNHRIKDTFAVLSYSHVFLAFSVLILFPIELIIFGGNLFRLNPNPFELKSAPAYLLGIVEGLVHLWSFVLLCIGFYVQSGNKILSIINSLLFYGLISTIIFLVIKFLVE